mmetsp:Transcript_25194/g.41982  ORF Transcript_25194/g.41982 Transcript_25194/m.41982 type:complete len:202 (+) Transcript_25194:38-643(+)
MSGSSNDGVNGPESNIIFVDYKDESMLPDIQRLVSKDLSEPYSVFTYRYFVHNCPRFCICAYDLAANGEKTMIATIVCKLEGEGEAMEGYMAMLAVDKEYRKKGIGRKLSTMVIDRMIEDGCRLVTLETEASNKGALSLYMKLGFVKEEKMVKYYLNSGDAYRLKLWISEEMATRRCAKGNIRIESETQHVVEATTALSVS